MITFSGGTPLDVDRLWGLYLSGMSYAQIAHQAGVSSSTVKRRIRGVKKFYLVSEVSGGVVHLDVTYWGRNKGLILAIDSKTGVALYHKWIGHERQQDYIDGIDHIERNGYDIWHLC